MKKLSVFFITVFMAACILVGCGSSDNKDTENKNDHSAANNETNSDLNNTAEVNDSFVFTFKDTDVQINAEMDQILDKLGKEDSYFESESCAFQGLDKAYTYGSVVIQTYPIDEIDYVYSVELKDDTVETPEGVYIGASVTDVEKAYGTPDNQTDIAYIYVQGESQLNIMFEDDMVTSIVYVSTAE